MKDLLKITLVPFALAAFTTAANAQANVYQDPDKCMAEMTALDSDGDGFITGDEMGTRGTIATQVDTNDDGRIAPEELTVACDNNLVQALNPKGD